MAKLETKIYDARISDLTETEHNPRQISKTISRSLWTRKARSKMTTTNKVLELDNAYAWDIQVRTIDKLETTTVSLVVSVGIPIFRIGTDGYVYNNEKRLIPEDELPRYSTHVGQVIMSTTLSTAAAVGFVRLNVPVIITTRTMPKKCGTFLSIRTGNFVWCPYRGWV